MLTIDRFHEFDAFREVLKKCLNMRYKKSN